ncbi:MAG: hypothetical protein ACD_76C00044G0015 [uncultured bacterium]|nr:MAG: hypothetical protein ACD_76C00044G0015 [uncultured bacterium]HBD05192.1 hypothetical protein [Candidatus Uhrbacteria bacterium]
MEREPSSQENQKQELIEGLSRLKTDYKDGIPDEIKHSVSKDSGWKVQRGVWFQAVALRLSDILRRQYGGEAIIPKGLFDEVLVYYRKLVNDDNPLKQRLTVQSDIDEAEAIIDKLITELEK